MRFHELGVGERFRSMDHPYLGVLVKIEPYNGYSARPVVDPEHLVYVGRNTFVLREGA